MKFIYLRATLLLIAMCAVALFPVYAMAGGDKCQSSHNQCGHDGNGNTSDDTADSFGGSGYGGDGGAGGAGGSVGDIGSESVSVAEAEASAEASATSSSSAEGGSATAQGGTVGDININTGANIPANTTHSAKIRVENTPDMVNITPGSGDDCKAHIGASLSIPGLGTGLTIPLPGVECRKLKYYDRMIAAGQYQTAEFMFCALKDVKKEFKAMHLDCVDTLTIYVVPEPVTQQPDTFSVNEMVAQLTDEQYEKLKQEMFANDAEQQKIDAQQMEQYQVQQAALESQADELARLRREAKALRDAEEARKREEAEAQAKFAARLKAKEAAPE